MSETYTFPLSFAQQRLWFLDQLAGGNPFYNVPAAMRLKVALDPEVLERSLNEIVSRHEALRTRFVSVDGQPRQVIEEEQRLRLRCHDLRPLPAAQREIAARDLAAEEARTPFDLSSGPLMRAVLVQLGPADCLFLVTMHHIVSDGWSMGVFFQEMTTVYGALIARRPALLPKLPLQYADFAVWQRAWLQGPALEEQLAYWIKQLKGLSNLALPTDRPRPAVPTYRGARLSQELPPSLSAALNALGQRTGATLFMTLLAAFQVLLHRYSGQNDIVVGVPIAGRTRPDLEKLIGFFVNTLVLRADCTDNPRFIDFLGQVRETALGAYAHQDVPFELLVERLHPDRDVSRNPLFQIGFALQNAAATASGSRVAHNGNGSSKPNQMIEVERGTAIFDLALHIWETPRGLATQVEYSTELFESVTIQRLLGHFQTLLTAIANDPAQRLSELPLLTARERQQLLVEWNATDTPYPNNTTLHALFEAQAQRTPQAVAVVSRDESVSYEELNRRANRIAARLVEHGVQADVPVALCVERGVALVAGILGVLKAGGAYVPLDPEYPVGRLQFMLRDSQARVLLASPGTPEVGDAVERLLLDGWEADPGEAANLAARANSENLAYIIYTSGSTGTPKGVMVPHRGLCNVLSAQQRLYRLEVKSRVLQFASLSFDASIFELMLAFGCGGTAFVPPRDEVLPGPDLAAYLSRNQIQIVTLPPSALAAIGLEELPASLETINVAGEACPEELAARWSAKRRFFNLYGPTEATIWATTALCDGNGKPSIGTPIENVRVYVLDQKLQLVPIGVPGELWIGGAGVARGYVNPPEGTDSRFIADPFQRDPSARLYRTGDLVRWRSDGALDYLGRLDHQVKLRSYRIELGDIESALRDHRGVAEAVAAMRNDGPGGQRIVAYVTQNPDYTGSDGPADALALTREKIADWRAIYDSTYAKNGDSSANSDFHGWNSSYTGLPIEDSEMRDWLEEVVQRVLELKPRRVLEIGCGKGLILFRVAPHCLEYVGTDLSAAALRQLEASLEGRALPHVKLLHRTAEDFSGLSQGVFDLVILNSVVQYFPGIDYLLEVMEGVGRVLAPRGKVFVGDVRSLPLIEAFHASVELHSAPPTLSRAAISRRLRNRSRQEGELLLDPTFFAALARRVPNLTNAQAMPKETPHLNELSCFRFDVVLGGEAPVPLNGAKRIEWKSKFGNAEWGKELWAHLEAEQSNLLLLDVPDARSERHVRLCGLLADEGDADLETAGDLAETVARISIQGAAPRQMREIVEGLPYGVQFRCAASGNPGKFDVLFWRKGNGSEPAPKFCIEPGRPRLWHQYASNPLQGMMAQRLLPSLRAHLKQRLPEYMIPGSLVLLEELPLGPNGKVDRQALPAPDGVRPDLGVQYSAPRTPAEATLAQIWADVLRLDQVGIQDNFFELGGDSILSIQIIARANRAGLNLTPPQLFQHQTIAELAAVAGAASAVLAEQEPLEGEAPLTPIQHWFFEHPRRGPEHFNQVVLLPLEWPNRVRLQEALATLVRHHDALRLRLVREETRWRQFHGPIDESSALDQVDLSALEGEAQARALTAAAAQAQASLNLQHGPLLRTRLFDLGGGQCRLLLVIHHLAVDGVSWRILLEDLGASYDALCRGQAPQLPRKTTSFKQWALRLKEYAASSAASEELEFWREQAPRQGEESCPVDFERSAEDNLVESVAEMTTVLEAAATQALLQQLPAAYRTQINDALLTALLRTWQSYSGRDSLWLNLEGHGREDLFEDVDLTRTVGWFTSLFPVKLECSLEAGCAQRLQAVKEQLRRVPRHGIGYGVLRYLSPDARVRQALAELPTPLLSFNYLGQLTGDSTPQDLGSAHAPQDRRAHLIEINASVEQGTLRTHWAYSRKFHRHETIERLATRFTEELRALIELSRSPNAAAYTPSDFPDIDLTQSELDRVFAELESATEEQHT